MLKKISFQLLGTLVLRGGFFITFMLATKHFPITEIAALGLLLLISNSISTCIAMAFGIECRNRIVNHNRVVIGNIKYFLLTILFFSFISVYLYNYLEVIKSISIINYLLNLILISVLLYLQQMVYALDLIKQNSLLNLIIGIGWFLCVFLYFPEEINQFLTYYNIMIFFQIFLITLLLILNQKKRAIIFEEGAISINFLVNYAVYAVFGLPIFMLAQIILEKSTNTEVLAKVVILTQITNLVGFFNTQLLTVLYNKLVVINSFETLNHLVRNYRLFNLILVIFVFSLYYLGMYFSKDIGLVFSFRDDLLIYIVNIAAFCLTSYYWVYNDFLIGKNKVNIVKIFNIVFGVSFLLLIFLFYAVFKTMNVYPYIIALFLARVLVIYMANNAIKGYFYENING